MFDAKIILAMGWPTVLTISAGIFALPNNAFAQEANLTMIVTCADVDPTHLPPQQLAPQNRDAPSPGATLNYAVVKNGQITSSGVIQDGKQGWMPDGMTWAFYITGIDADPNSVVAINVIDPTCWPVCVLNGMFHATPPEGAAGIGNMTTTTSNATSQ